jgi:pimeloyl-ACP methyl ester carboxylesterase
MADPGWLDLAARGGPAGALPGTRSIPRAWMVAPSAKTRSASASPPRRNASEIAELLFYEDLRDVVMVGTSSGGMVLCRTAEAARDQIARLVFVDALALFNGEHPVRLQSFWTQP